MHRMYKFIQGVVQMQLLVAFVLGLIKHLIGFLLLFLLDQKISQYQCIQPIFFLKYVSAKKDVSPGVSRAKGEPLWHCTVSWLAFFFLPRHLEKGTCSKKKIFTGEKSRAKECTTLESKGSSFIAEGCPSLSPYAGGCPPCVQVWGCEAGWSEQEREDPRRM